MGRGEAINKGFARTSGDVMGWLGSDDLLMPWSLSIIGEVFAAFPEIEWLTTLFPTSCDSTGTTGAVVLPGCVQRRRLLPWRESPVCWLAGGWIHRTGSYVLGGAHSGSAQAGDLTKRSNLQRTSTVGPLPSVGCPALQCSHPACWLSQPRQSEIACRVSCLRRRGTSCPRRYGGEPPMTAKVFLLRRVLLRVLPQRLLRKAAKLMEDLLGLPHPRRRGAVIHGWPRNGMAHRRSLVRRPGLARTLLNPSRRQTSVQSDNR